MEQTRHISRRTLIWIDFEMGGQRNLQLRWLDIEKAKTTYIRRRDQA